MQGPWGLLLQAAGLLETAPHVFTTRESAGTGDGVPARAVEETLGVAAGRLLFVRQVHGAEVAVVRPPDRDAWQPPEADAIVTEDPLVAIGVRVADCAPILLADKTRTAVAAVHAGWRGTMRGVTAAAVRTLGREFGCRPADLIAAIGPCLGCCCGEVGEEVVEAFREAGHGQFVDRWFATGPTARPYLDLVRANRDQLLAAGVPAGAIASADLCTKTNAAIFHSYRVDGRGAGRMIAAVKPALEIG